MGAAGGGMVRLPSEPTVSLRRNALLAARAVQARGAGDSRENRGGQPADPICLYIYIYKSLVTTQTK